MMALVSLPFVAAACSGAADPRAGDDGAHAAQAVAGVSAVDPDLVRFLQEATFGATPDSVAQLQTLGPSTAAQEAAFLTAQMDRNKTPPTWYATQALAGVGIQDQLWNHALTAQDQLRQRVAFALSEIFVVSNVKIKNEDGMVDYLNVLLNDAFGSYQQLLTDVTQNPAMGQYLDMAGNYDLSAKGVSLSPNENYAREVMQLFSIGLYELDPETGQPIQPLTPTYPQGTVESLSHVFTGWDYPGGTTCAQGKRNPVDLPYTPPTGSTFTPTPLVTCEANHDGTAEWEMLGGYHAGSTADGWSTQMTMTSPVNPYAHTSGAMAAIATHPNVAGFICKQLIQHLVTSNPSADYLSYVVAAFNDGNGNLGDAVTAILTYPGVRGAAPTDADVAHLREPVVYMSNLLRLFTAPTGSGVYGAGWSGVASNMGQNPYYSPTVFNYFPPNQPLPQNPGMLGPEFGILDTNTVVYRANFANTIITGNYNKTVIGNTQQDLSHVDGSSAQNLVAWMNTYMMGGSMSSALRSYILGKLPQGTAALTPAQIEHGIYIAATAAEFQIER
jgi:uncharacterized protein (DUF1800 family)